MSKCEVCRHPYWDNHVQAVRLNAFTEEAVKGRCRDCVACQFGPSPVAASQSEREAVAA